MITWRVDRALVDPIFATNLEALLMPDDGEWIVTYGFRTRDEQALLYARWVQWLQDNPNADPSTGPRAAPPGSSAHEGAGVPGTGEAVDVSLVVNSKTNWDYAGPKWRWLVVAVKAAPHLHSLDAIGDTDHIEATNWRDAAQAAKEKLS